MRPRTRIACPLSRDYPPVEKRARKLLASERPVRLWARVSARRAREMARFRLSTHVAMAFDPPRLRYLFDLNCRHRCCVTRTDPYSPMSQWVLMMATLEFSTPWASKCHSPIDEDLNLRIRLYFDTLHLPALTRVQVNVEQGNVTMEGIVRSFYERQLALACARRVAGVRRITDHIRVLDSGIE